MEDNIVEINSLQEFLELAKEEEMTKEEKMLREYIRKKISKIIFEQEKQEYQLRTIIRKLLREGDISDIHPHRSTAINTLEDVLKKAIPTLRKDYKNLTTDKSQRESFRAHILKAMKDIVAPAMNNAKYASGGALLSEPAALGGDAPAPRAQLRALLEVRGHRAVPAPPRPRHRARHSGRKLNGSLDEVPDRVV